MTTPDHLDPRVLEQLCLAARSTADDAAETIRRHYAYPSEARLKPDQSPVTDADEAAEAVIVERLRALGAGYPVISEESVARGAAADTGREVFWLVDPLDGTREFLARNGEFTVNIALVAAGVPVIGVIVAPATGECYFAFGEGRAFHSTGGGEARHITARRCPAEGAIGFASRSHGDVATDRFLAGAAVREIRHLGSSLKFCRLAEGVADLYPRFGQTMEWDTAAGHAILVAAGGSVRTPDGAPLGYGKPGLRNPPFIARGRD